MLDLLRHTLDHGKIQSDAQMPLSLGDTKGPPYAAVTTDDLRFLPAAFLWKHSVLVWLSRTREFAFRFVFPISFSLFTWALLFPVVIVLSRAELSNTQLPAPSPRCLFSMPPTASDAVPRALGAPAAPNKGYFFFFFKSLDPFASDFFISY